MAEIKEKSITTTAENPELSLYDRFKGLKMSPEDRARVEAAERTTDRRAAQNVTIRDGVTAHWHVLEVFAGTEYDTVDWLAERGFGVYLPVFFVDEIMRGVKRPRRRKLIPGYVFVFVWDIEAHRARIMSCETVSKIMMDGNSAAKVKDETILKLRATEIYLDRYREIARKKRRRRRNRRNLDFYAQLQDIKIETLFY